MFVESYNDVCFEVLDFISEFERKIILDTAKRQDNWNGAVEEGFWSGKITEIYTEEQRNIEARINNMFLGHENVNPLDNISRFFPGDAMGKHYDASGSDKIAYGVILYLNDDYEGGELYYPDHDIKIKPKSGSMLFHRSDVWHEVLPVTEGVRYFMTTFVNGRNAKLRSFAVDS